MNCKVWKTLEISLLCLLILCGCGTWSDALSEEGSGVSEGNSEIEVIGEKCNIYDIIGDYDIDEIVAVEVYINGSTAAGQSYVVEKEVAPNLLQELVDVVFTDEEIYREIEISHEWENYDYSLKYEFVSGETITIYVEHGGPDWIIYDGNVYQSHKEIESEMVNYGIREGFSRGNAVVDIGEE